ncbi:hypothetical protein C1645_128912 [Glomus cerebriforme]|uniref:Uncharacterized protein n=1 Tax=Glomus cerebriforme TaxID=658196 RepID=A0A397TPE4_9GLOM|nr:hypothetical protein C1645_128912 [Glomus cerebriforme]
MDSDASAAHLFVGNIGSKKSPSKASTTTSISSDQICTNTARAPFWSTEATMDNDTSVAKHLSQLIVHENEELDDNFVDAVESQESNFGEIRIKELSPFTQKCNNKRASSIYSLPTTLNTVYEDDSYSHMSDYDDNFSESSFAPSDLFSSLSSQISFNRCSRSGNLVEKVTVSNPIRIGTGMGSYVVYTCTVNGPDVRN